MTTILLVAGTLCAGVFVLYLDLVSGKEGTALLLVMLALALLVCVPLLLFDIRGRWLLALPLALFWVPAPTALGGLPSAARGLSLVEALAFLSLVVLLVRFATAQQSLPAGDVRSLPWVGLMFIVLGAAFAYTGTPQANNGLSALRTIVVLPIVLGVLIVLTVRSSGDARRALWVLVGSSAVLGLLFLVGSSTTETFLRPSTYAIDMGLGRASVTLSIPHFSVLTLNPESAGDKFAIAFVLAWFLLLTSRKATGRLLAALGAIVCAAVVVTAQGRGGLIACALAAASLGVWGMRRGKPNRLTASAATLALMAGLLTSALLLARRSGNSEYTARIMGLISDPGGQVTAGRLQLWREGYSYAVSHPFGLGVYPPQYAADSTWLTHNLWLFAALTLGWLGLIGLLWVMLRLGAAYTRGMRAHDTTYSDLAFLGFVLLLVILLLGMFSPLVWEPFSAVLVWAPLWITFAAATLSPRAKTIEGDVARITSHAEASNNDHT